MASRSADTADRLTVARLSGTTRRLIIEKVATDDALAEVRAITTRADLLAQAAGTFMARHRDDPRTNPYAQACADLLLAAGADLSLADQEAAVVAQRIRTAAAGVHDRHRRE